MLTPSRNFAGHKYVWKHVKTVIGLKGELIKRPTLHRVDSEGRLLKRARCSKKVQVAAHRAGLPNPKRQLA